MKNISSQLNGSMDERSSARSLLGLIRMARHIASGRVVSVKALLQDGGERETYREGQDAVQSSLHNGVYDI